MNLLKELLYPPKCLFCQKPLSRGQVDLCPNCREDAPEFAKSKIKHSFIAQWTCLWYYKDKARRSILRYKFYHKRSYALSFSRLLAIKLQKEGFDDVDVLTWVPISRLRRLTRGFDQVELLTKAISLDLQVPAVSLLKKIRHTPPQSGIRDAAQRRANVIGAYTVPAPSLVQGNRILLLDDVITSGATASECAKMLCTAGAKEVRFAAIASAEHPMK